MKIRAIPQNTLTAVVTLLQPYAPEITHTGLVAALRNAENDTTGGGSLRPMLTKHQAAEILGISTYTVIRMLRRGELRGSKIGQAWRVSGEHIAELAGEG